MAAHLTREQIEKALALQRKCYTHERIAEALGVHRTTVSRTLAKVNRRTMQRLERRGAATRAKQIRQLEWVAMEAIDGWERSKQDALTIKTTDEGESDADGIGYKTETTRKRHAGTPTFLSEARAALADVRKILGLDAAEKLTSKTQDDHPGPSTIPEDDPRFLADGGEPAPEGTEGSDVT